MRLIIDIPEEDYKFIKELKLYFSGRRSGKTIERNVINAIKNGTPYEERPKGEWIPIDERFPKDETEVLIQYGQSMMVGYHIFDYTIYPSGFEDENETGWYDSKDDFICGSDEVIAWMPLPEQYKEAEE